MQRLIHLSSAAVYGNGVRLKKTRRFTAAAVSLRPAQGPPRTTARRIRMRAVAAARHQPSSQPVTGNLDQPCYVACPNPIRCCNACTKTTWRRRYCCASSDVRGAITGGRGQLQLPRCHQSRHRLSVPLPLSVARRPEPGGKLSGWGGEPAWIDGPNAAHQLPPRPRRTRLA